MSNIRKTVKYRRIFLSLLLCAALLTTQLSAVAFAADIGDPDEAASSAGTEMASGQEEDESENEGEYMPEGTGSGESEPENENLPDEADSQEGETGEGGLPEGTDTGSENAGTEDENLEQDMIVSDSAKTVMETVNVSGNEETEQVNLALGLLSDSANYTYEITGGGTGYDSTGTYKDDGTRYTVAELENESLYRLTDGEIINETSVYFYDGWEPELWNNTESLRSKYIEIYRNDFRILTIDLGETSNINQVRMHFGAVEDYGIYMPTEVAFYASEDGETYYLIQNVNVNDTSEDPNDANVTCASSTQAPYHLWFETDEVSYNARYIKIVFPVNVYIFSDELQVLGYTATADDADDLAANEVYDKDSREVGSYATTAQTGGVKNEYMAYSGWYINSDGDEVYNTYKTTDEYLSAITYVDEDGVPQDWLFDDVVVMGHYYTSGGKFVSYKAGYKSGEYYATQEDWYEWLCYAFGMDTEGNSLSYDGYDTINLNALEEAAAIAKEALNDPDYKVGVKLVVYPAVEFQENWGTLNGETIDFTIDGAGSKEKALENRTAAYQWYIDTALQMWEDAGFENLELTGFYYYEETIHESTDRIAEAATQALTSIVHSASTPSTNTTEAFDDRQGGRLYIFQLPYYQSEGYYKWADYGFDYALMQPNYAFYDTYTVTQLYECGELCQYYGLGMQMEFGGAGNRGYTMKFEDYLELGQEIGYQDSVLSWYMSTYGCYQISQNEYDLRYLYDAIYQFVKGEAISFDEEETEMDPTVSTYNLALGVEAEFSYGEILGIQQYWTVSEIEGAVGLLTDGINDSANFWVNDITNYYIGINPSLISGPYTFTFDLGDTYRLSSLHSYFGDRQGWGYYAPTSVTYEVSVDGETWVTAGTVSADEAEVNSVYDERNPDSIPDIYDFGLDVDYDGYRYVRITFEANGTGTIFFGEMEVYGTVCMDTEETYDLAGNLIPSFEYAENLQDVLYWSVSEINAALEILSDDITNSPNYWVNATSNYYIGINKTYISGPYGFIYDLGYHYKVTKLESYFYDRPAWGVAAPESVDYYGSTDGETWVLLGSVSKSDAIVETVEDTRNPDDTPPDIYNFALEGDFSGYSYVKAVFSAADSVNVVACGEFDVYGTSDRNSSTSDDSTDTTQLEKLIDAAGEIDGASYTTDSYQTLEEALAAAQAVLADENASQDEIDAAAAALEAALGALTLVDTGTENDDGSDDDSDDGSDNEDENTGSDGTAATDTDASDPGTTGSETTAADSSADGVKSPATGDESSIWLFVFGLVAAAAAGGLILIEARKSGRNSG